MPCEIYCWNVTVHTREDEVRSSSHQCHKPVLPENSRRVRKGRRLKIISLSILRIRNSKPPTLNSYFHLFRVCLRKKDSSRFDSVLSVNRQLNQSMTWFCFRFFLPTLAYDAYQLYVHFLKSAAGFCVNKAFYKHRAITLKIVKTTCVSFNSCTWGPFGRIRPVVRWRLHG